ncbi:hypothetical protein GCM10022393_05780 [Aquimarina addita]|uniref:DUF4377 domain-containing protein n=1 Tax=Aquimarina addita TaxID=870485 RepID=A0ABP7XAD6_9FLAO
MSKMIPFLAGIFLLLSCKETKTVYIASYQTNCQGVGSQTCMLYKENSDDEWTYFYDTIEGFEYEEGYNYTLEIEVSKAEKTITDTSSLTYSLVNIIAKEKDNVLAQNLVSNQDESMKIIYSALSRGYFLKTEIDQRDIIVFKDRNLDQKKSKNCSKKQWNEIRAMVEKIDLKKIGTLEAPTGKRLHDGAPHAKLEISKGDQKFISNGFDHGHPPKELASLVTYIVSLTEGMEE